MAKKDVPVDVFTSRAAPTAWLEETPSGDIAKAISDLGLEKSAEIVAALMQHHGPTLGEMADDLVDQATNAPHRFVGNLMMGMLTGASRKRR
jgi:hypothetical protein